MPKKLFDTPYSTVVFDKDYRLLGAKIAQDGQWRFPAPDSIPNKFETCLLTFEDEYFYYHFGFNPVSIVKSLYGNIKSGSIKRGGSTITQQVIRLSRKQNRTYLEKIKELILATRLEFRNSKQEILNLYASHAPFGGNVVGLEMASWRYFGTTPHRLSWAESATLAVLPNAPSLIFPGKHQELLKQKRDRLLKKIWQKGKISKLTYELAIQESLPEKPFPVPQESQHFLEFVSQRHKGQRVQTSIDKNLQEHCHEIAKSYYQKYAEQHIYNLGILVLDLETNKVLSYVGNSPTDIAHEKDVDMVLAPRSTGSTLKPFLYMAMLNEGKLLPNSLIADIPTRIHNYQPKNFDLKFSGAIPASLALSQSLNIPAVRMLQSYGLEKFYDEIKYFNFKEINKGSHHYGLSLILGGGETSLWNITNAYATLGKTLNDFQKYESQYNTTANKQATYLQGSKPPKIELNFDKSYLDAGSIYLGLKAITEVNRPEGDENWKYYYSAKKISWKTGTSFGNKDAWAIGINKKYAVGIWVGNADGEGIAGMTGVSKAGPILFDVFNLLPNNSWFTTPYDDLHEENICTISGFKAKDCCPQKKEWIQTKGENTPLCPFHKEIFTDVTGNYRVNTSCEKITQMIPKIQFELPPSWAWYYQKTHSNYKAMPPFRNDCTAQKQLPISFISPKNNARIVLPKNLNEEINPIVIKAAHQNTTMDIHWYLDEQYLKTTHNFHEISLTPTLGEHRITILDELGNKVQQKIFIE